MSRPQPIKLTVINKTLITPHMLRITLGGEDIKNIPEDQESGYVKLVIPNDDIQTPENSKPLMRTYTIRHQRSDSIDIDFMLHGDSGLASNWAKHAKLNDTITIAGVGSKRMIHMPSDWYLVVGDMTALPAISVNLAELPSDAKGYAVIEVVSEEDIQTIEHPTDVTLKWIINPTPGQNPNALLEAIQSLDWLNGEVAVWAACEFNSMRALRPFLKIEKKVSKEALYLSSYWKLGMNEDQHKIEKRIDADRPIPH